MDNLLNKIINPKQIKYRNTIKAVIVSSMKEWRRRAKFKKTDWSTVYPMTLNLSKIVYQVHFKAGN